jgi:hypothetical protein
MVRFKSSRRRAVQCNEGKMNPIKRASKFWKRFKIIPGGCWIWTGAKFKSGYGRVKWDGKHQRINRVAFRLSKGKIRKGMFVCHDCDNKLCGNPDHLFEGTHVDNMQDCLKKGRWRKYSSDILPDKRIIAFANKDLLSRKKIAKLIGSSQSSVSRLFKRYESPFKRK